MRATGHRVCARRGEAARSALCCRGRRHVFCCECTGGTPARAARRAYGMVFPDGAVKNWMLLVSELVKRA